jgi:glycosyltransferase involved in cell wall biosynthesis
MRILWAAPPPSVPTAYAMQSGMFAPRIRDLGHQVVYSQFAGSPMGGYEKRGDDIYQLAREWEGIPLIGRFRIPQRGDQPQIGKDYQLPRPMEIREAFGGREPDIVIALKDAWALDIPSFKSRPAAVWLNFDTEPMGRMDRAWFDATGARCIPVSRWGLAQCRAAGYTDAAYIPHGIEMSQWQPPASKAAAKELLGLDPGLFVAGMNAANIGVPPRKAFGEQFAGFAAFHVKHPRSVLLANTIPENEEGINLRHVVRALGIEDAVKFPHLPQDHDAMVTWYQALDVLMQATYGEGFGVPVLEAQACGVPVIASRCTALTEKIRPGTGWLVNGVQWWHPNERAWWHVPDHREITKALGKALNATPQPGLCVQAASEYDADLITATYWKPFLDSLED